MPIFFNNVKMRSTDMKLVSYCDQGIDLIGVTVSWMGKQLLLTIYVAKKNPIAEKKVREFDIGVRVKTRNYLSERKWQFGIIQEKLGKLHYMIRLDDGRRFGTVTSIRYRKLERRWQKNHIPDKVVQPEMFINPTTATLTTESTALL